MGDNVINVRTTYDKFIDKDEIGGPNDSYQNLSIKFGNIASTWQAQINLDIKIEIKSNDIKTYFLSVDFIIEDMSTILANHFKILLTREW